MRFPVRIVVADDFEEWRAYTRTLLQSRPAWEVIGEACDGLEAVRWARELGPEVVLLDLGMPNLNGLEAAAQIRKSSPDSCIVFVTNNNDRDIRNAALALGAEYVLKNEASRELIPSIDAVLHNRHR